MKEREIIENRFNNLSKKIDNIQNVIEQHKKFSYVITDNLKERMKEKVLESVEKDIELGFSLCKNIITNILTGMNNCEGVECSVKIKKFKCNDNEIMMGIFHTHSNDEPNASITDLKIAYKTGLNIIGGLDEDGNVKILSYERKNDYNEETMKEISEMSINELNTLKKDKELWKEINNFFTKHKHFKKVEDYKEENDLWEKRHKQLKEEFASIHENEKYILENYFNIANII